MHVHARARAEQFRIHRPARFRQTKLHLTAIVRIGCPLDQSALHQVSDCAADTSFMHTRGVRDVLSRAAPSRSDRSNDPPFRDLEPEALLVDLGQVIAHARGKTVEPEGGEVRQEQGRRRGGMARAAISSAKDLIPDAHRAGSSEQGVESGGHYRLLKRLRAQLMCNVRKCLMVTLTRTRPWESTCSLIKTDLAMNLGQRSLKEHCPRVAIRRNVRLRPVCRTVFGHGVHRAASCEPAQLAVSDPAGGDARRVPTHRRWASDQPLRRCRPSPNQLRWNPLPIPPEPTDFVSGLRTPAGNGVAGAAERVWHPLVRREPVDGRPLSSTTPTASC